MRTPRNHAEMILASASPRRKYLLEQAGLHFTVIPGDVDETAKNDAAPDDHVRFLAEAKADAIARAHPRAWVLGADTAVVIEDLILGKPADRQQARAMLNRLSGRKHRVHTGYAIVCRAQDCRRVAVVTTEVEFKRLSALDIQWYLNTGEPFDKAGAYAIQGMGTFLVRCIHGSYSNVVGLPVCEVVEELMHLGVVRRPAPDG